MREIEERETGISKFCRFVEEEKCLVSPPALVYDSYIQLYISSEDTVSFRDSVCGSRAIARPAPTKYLVQKTFCGKFIVSLV